ncbi:MAG: hypothetical protein ACLP9L_25420 [Thermoguttaceae bacterium]
MDDSFWEEIERFKNVPGSRKMTESVRLFDAAMRRMLAGIKSQFPGISEEEARRIRRERLDRIRRMEALP